MKKFRKEPEREWKKMKIKIYRGTHQIGGCATEISTEKHRIVIDFGTNLPDHCQKDTLSDEELLKAVFDHKVCDGVLFTHYHGDHVGLYKKIPKDIPLYIGPTAKKILEILIQKVDSVSETGEKGLSRVQNIRCYLSGRKELFGDIKITPFMTDHSALDSYMFLIEADGKKVLFTGDFREHGIIGENNTLEKMVQAYIGKINLLITEGTMLSRMGETQRNSIRTEAELGRRAEELFRANKESVILVSSTNLDSIMEFYHAVPWGMDFVCDAYQAKLILTAMADKGKYYPKYRPVLIHGKPRRFYIIGDLEGLGAKENCFKADFSILKKKGFTMLARENKMMFRECMEEFTDPLIIYSKWTGYLEGKHADPKIRDFIGKHRMEILHTSGHAYVETIEKLIHLTNPEIIIPMHTEYAEKFSRIPAFAPYQDRVRALCDGEEYCLSPFYGT